MGRPEMFRDDSAVPANNLAAEAVALNAAYGHLSALEILDIAINHLFAGRLALVSSFGAESAVLLHMASTIDPSLPVVFLDTKKLFGETKRYRDTLIARLGLTDVRTVTPDETRIAEVDRDGTMWASNPDLCCHVRRVEPLARAIQGFGAWITGRKRFQGGARSTLAVFEASATHIKVNPLASWTPAEIEAYLTEHDLPRHPLVADGYRSIGCLPCTDRVAADEDARAGRWRGREKTECGIHLGQNPMATRRDADPEGPVWRDGAFRRDEWTAVSDEGPLGDGAIVVSKARWLAERETLKGRNAAVGLVLGGGDMLDDIADDLSGFQLIALRFPKFADGRGYSIARLLREKHGFTGELRAVGDILADQIPFLLRVGFDALEVSHGPSRTALAKGRLAAVTHYYQPASDAASTIAGARPWLRRAALGNNEDGQ